MPPSKDPPQKNAGTVSSNSSANTWVFLMKGDILDDAKNENQLEVVKLRHPASSKPAVFIFTPRSLRVQEILVFNEGKRSWFIDDGVKSDGKLHLSTPIDPLFLVLPYLRKSQLAQPLEQCLSDEDFPGTSCLARCKNLNLSLIADRKGEDSLQAFKFNEEKSLKWLQNKIEKVAKVLKQKGVHVSQGAVSATYVKSTKFDTGTETEYLRYAHGIVSEYLAEDLSKKLAEHLNIPEEAESKKRKPTSPDKGTDEKRSKKDPEESPTSKPKLKKTTNSKKSQTNAAPSKQEIAIQRAAAGSKSITSFFKKK